MRPLVPCSFSFFQFNHFLIQIDDKLTQPSNNPLAKKRQCQEINANIFSELSLMSLNALHSKMKCFSDSTALDVQNVQNCSS